MLQIRSTEPGVDELGLSQAVPICSEKALRQVTRATADCLCAYVRQLRRREALHIVAEVVRLPYALQALGRSGSNRGAANDRRSTAGELDQQRRQL